MPVVNTINPPGKGLMHLDPFVVSKVGTLLLAAGETRCWPPLASVQQEVIFHEPVALIRRRKLKYCSMTPEEEVVVPFM